MSNPGSVYVEQAESCGRKQPTPQALSHTTQASLPSSYQKTSHRSRRTVGPASIAIVPRRPRQNAKKPRRKAEKQKQKANRASFLKKKMATARQLLSSPMELAALAVRRRIREPNKHPCRPCANNTLNNSSCISVIPGILGAAGV